MQTHHLKTWPEFFEQVWLGLKPFEIRRDDRGYRAGDTVVLEEWNPRNKQYTGRSLEFRISYLLCGGAFGLRKGFCAFGILPTHDAEQRIAADGGKGGFWDCPKCGFGGNWTGQVMCARCETPRPPLPGDGASDKPSSDKPGTSPHGKRR